jgi:hypothetical protein
VKSVIVETNVIAVANGEAEQASPACVIACLDALEAARRKTVVIDSNELCFKEYFRHASWSGQPGAGDEFAKWLWDRQAYTKHCERVALTPKSGEQDGFDEFPDDPELRGFDRSDRKFVAIAKASRRKPTILNATDTDWWNFRTPLGKNGIRIHFLCPELMIRR